jgi:hypothetical protein
MSDPLSSSEIRERATQLIKQANCQHKDKTGGNDYQLCNECDLMWDYRREKPADALLRYQTELLALLASRETPTYAKVEDDSPTLDRIDANDVARSLGADVAGRLLLNAYGRRCYDAGRESASRETPRQADELRELAREISTVQSVLQRKSELSRDEFQQVAILERWIQRLHSLGRETPQEPRQPDRE